MSSFDRYVGIPYLDRGRGICGLDCYGLVCLVYRELRGIDLPSYAEGYVTAADRRAIARLVAGGLSDWAVVKPGAEQAFDGCLMREGAHPTHIGLVVAPGQVLHIERGQTSRIQRYRDGMLAARVIGFYRYQAT